MSRENSKAAGVCFRRTFRYDISGRSSHERECEWDYPYTVSVKPLRFFHIIIRSAKLHSYENTRLLSFPAGRIHVNLRIYRTNPLSPNGMEDVWDVDPVGGIDIDTRACRTLPCGCLEATSGRERKRDYDSDYPVRGTIAFRVAIAIAISIVIVFGYQKTAKTPHLNPADCASQGGFVRRFT